MRLKSYCSIQTQIHKSSRPSVHHFPKLDSGWRKKKLNDWTHPCDSKLGFKNRVPYAAKKGSNFGSWNASMTTCQVLGQIDCMGLSLRKKMQLDWHRLCKLKMVPDSGHMAGETAHQNTSGAGYVSRHRSPLHSHMAMFGRDWENDIDLVERLRILLRRGGRTPLIWFHLSLNEPLPRSESLLEINDLFMLNPTMATNLPWVLTPQCLHTMPGRKAVCWRLILCSISMRASAISPVLGAISDAENFFREECRKRVESYSKGLRLQMYDWLYDIICS